MRKIIVMAFALTLLPITAGAQEIGETLDQFGKVNTIDRDNLNCVSACLIQKNNCVGATGGISMNPSRNLEAVRKSVACFREYVGCMQKCTGALADALAGFKN